MLATYVLIPAFGGRSDYYWAYTALGNNVPQAIGHLITHPASSLQAAGHAAGQARPPCSGCSGAFCFLPLRSPLSLAAIPLLLERMLAGCSRTGGCTSYQYNAYLVVVLLCAAVDGAARLDRSPLLGRRGPRRPGAGGIPRRPGARAIPGCWGTVRAGRGAGGPVPVVLAWRLVPAVRVRRRTAPVFYQRDAQEGRPPRRSRPCPAASPSRR